MKYCLCLSKQTRLSLIDPSILKPTTWYDLMYIISKLFEQEMSCVQYRRNKPLINGEEHPTEMVSYGAGLGNTAAVSYL